MKTKFLAVFLAVLTLTSLLCISANAVSSDKETLETNESYDCTDPISGYGAEAYIYNARSSYYKVYGYIEYKSGTKYVTDVKFLVAQGSTSPWYQSASYFSTKKTWQLEINPQGALFKNCTAEGTIKSWVKE